MQKAPFTHALQSFEDSKSTKKKAVSGTACPKPPAQARKCLVKSLAEGQVQEAWLNFNCMWCFNCQRHWGLQEGRRNMPQEKEGPYSHSSPGKEATSAWSSFRSITCGMVERPQTRQMSLSCVQLSVFWAARSKQCMLAAGKHQTLISWRKESTWRSNTLMWGCYETHFGASWPTPDMPPTMDFDGIVNSKTFSSGTVYQLFFLNCFISSLKYTLEKLSNIFTAQPLFG